ncbi:hypothetical protein ABW19_dt0203034 [Dactylella cylindrospora]|nr:hypothetical protein ABW19_dt0203034 [Dactylella cylindrospora]
MSVTSFRYLFTPEVLDGRLVSDISDNPPKDTTSKRDDRAGDSTGKSKRTSPPRWQTVEYFIYYAVFIIVVPMMFKAAYDISKANYGILKSLGQSKATPWAVWVFNVVMMCLNEWKRGYMFGRIFGADYAYIDRQYGGLMPRWEVHFNFTMLRIISFSMDYYWALTSGPDLEVNIPALICGVCLV